MSEEANASASEPARSAPSPAPQVPLPRESSQPREYFSREYVSELRQENNGWRLKAQEMEAARERAEAAAEQRVQEAARRAEQAEAAAAEKAAAAEARAQERMIRAELRTEALKAGMVDLDGLKLLDLSAVTVGEDGEVVIPEKLFADAKKTKPYLFGATSTSNPNPPPSREAPRAKRATEMENARDVDDLERRILRGERVSASV